MAGNVPSAIGANIGGGLFGPLGAVIGGAIGIIAGVAYDLINKPQVNVYKINVFLTVNINNYSLINSRCCASQCHNPQPNYFYHNCGNRLYFNCSQLTLRCDSCQLESSIVNYQFQCKYHAKRPSSRQNLMYALITLANQGVMNQQQLQIASMRLMQMF